MNNSKGRIKWFTKETKEKQEKKSFENQKISFLKEVVATKNYPEECCNTGKILKKLKGQKLQIF